MDDAQQRGHAEAVRQGMLKFWAAQSPEARRRRTAAALEVVRQVWAEHHARHDQAAGTVLASRSGTEE